MPCWRQQLKMFQLTIFILLASAISLWAEQTEQKDLNPRKSENTFHIPNKWILDRNIFPLVQPSGLKDRVCVIVQDAAPGAEVEVLETTSRVNRAYAKRWGHDYLKFTGIALGSEPWQATFNKPYLLSSLLLARGHRDDKRNVRILQRGNDDRSLPSYDIVLFLDSSAMIVQLDYDVLDLIAKDKMLAMASYNGVIHRDSNVMLWNLNHPQAMNVST